MKYSIPLLLLLGTANCYDGDRSLRESVQVLENYSFDFRDHKLPVAYDTYGAAVQTHHKYKLIPDVKERFGALVLKKPILSDRKFGADIDFTLQSNERTSHGFVIMLQADPPSFPDDFDPILGVKPDYKGLGVFIYRSESRNKWYIISIQNKGLDSIVMGGRDLDKQIHQQNSCEFDMISGQRQGVRIKIMYDYIYVDKREDEFSSFEKCLVSQIRDPFFHHLSVIANNQQYEERVSNIDINSIKVLNLDPKVYNDEPSLQAEKLELSMENQNVKQQVDGTYHPADIVAHKMSAHLEQENRKALTFLKLEDDKTDYIFKHYKTVQAHQHAYEEMIQKAQNYAKQEEYEGHFSLSAQNLIKVAGTIESIKSRTKQFREKYEAIRHSVTDALVAQLEEYKTSVDNNQKYGVHVSMNSHIESLNEVLNHLIQVIDDEYSYTKDFQKAHLEELQKKQQFYEEHHKHHGQGGSQTNSDPEKHELPSEIVDDIQFGIDTFRTALKEKLLGRKEGASRGQFDVSYNSTTLSLSMSAIMIAIILYIYNQVQKNAKTKMW